MKAKVFSETVVKSCNKECPAIQFPYTFLCSDLYLTEFVVDIIISHAKRHKTYLPCMESCLRSNISEDKATKNIGVKPCLRSYMQTLKLTEK